MTGCDHREALEGSAPADKAAACPSPWRARVGQGRRQEEGSGGSVGWRSRATARWCDRELRGGRKGCRRRETAAAATSWGEEGIEREVQIDRGGVRGRGDECDVGGCSGLSCGLGHARGRGGLVDRLGPAGH